PNATHMRVTQMNYFDSGGTTTPGIGNGNLTLSESYTSSTNHRDTVMAYDWRDRRISTENPLAPHSKETYDNLDRVIISEVFDDAAMTSSDRGRHAETNYSQRGLVYRQAIAIDPVTPADSLETHTWFDEVGRAVGHWGPNAPAQKLTFDGLGRTKVAYLVDRTD